MSEGNPRRKKPIFRACSSAGRAPRSQRGGRRFDPDHVHHLETTRKCGFFIGNEARLGSEVSGGGRRAGPARVPHLETTRKRGFLLGTRRVWLPNVSGGSRRAYRFAFFTI